MNCLQRMEQKSALFTKTDKIIADYIKEHRESVLSLSIVELGNRTKTSPASIIRFNQKLDYRNYNDFKMDLLRAFGDDVDNASRFVVSRDGVLEEFTNKLYAIPDNSIRATIDYIDFEALRGAIYALIKAKNIFLCASDTSIMAARDFNQKLLGLQRCAMFSDDIYTQNQYSVMAGEKDVLVVFSYSASAKEVFLSIKNAKKNGAKIICITRADNSELIKMCDYSLCIPVMMDDFNELRVRYAQTVIVDVLYMGMSNAFEITDEMIDELKQTKMRIELNKKEAGGVERNFDIVVKPNLYIKDADKICFSQCKIEFENDDKYIKQLAERVCLKCCSGDVSCGSLEIYSEIPEDIQKKIGDIYSANPEGFAIEIGETTKIYAENRSGVIFALSTIEQLYDNDNLFGGFLYDYPDKKIRGYKIYTPGYSFIPDFKRIVDMLVYYRYNAIMIEIGGAMEYKRRPEINEEWVKFCSQFKKSADTLVVQANTYPWLKNSIHIDNGDKAFISQDTMRELSEYCKERGLEVIPEVPTMSHSDYIVTTYPELNERVEDKHPDSYCPSNPKTYKVVFDIIDEVCEVFNPKYINIGHDELYTIGVCDECKKKSPVDLYVDDITKINNYLKGKGVTTLMWCEKLFNAYLPDGKPVGGADYEDGYTPALYECAGKIPKDVVMLNWYWDFVNRDFEEKDIRDNGYKMIYANFDALAQEQYRRGMAYSEGAITSNWGSLAEEYMQRTFQNFRIVSCAAILWSSEYNNDVNEQFRKMTKDELYRRHKRIIGENQIEIIHTTAKHIDFKYFYDGVFIEDELYILGYYNVMYSDGTREKLPVKYGYNISAMNVEINSDLYNEVQGAAWPFEKDGDMYYKTTYKNPHPEKTISGIYYEALPDSDAEVKVMEIRF